MARRPRRTKYNIICLSNQLWDLESFWTNKRHVMSRMAKHGNNVLFVDPQINFGRLFIRQLFRGQWPLKRLLTKTYTDDSGASIYTPINLLPARWMTPFHLPKIKKAAKKNFDNDRKTILWVYHVQLVGLEKYLAKMDYDILVYDCVDNYSAFPPAKSLFPANLYGDALIKQEKKLAEAADVVFASAPGLVDIMKKYNNNVYYTPNVGDFRRFKNSKSYKYKVPKKLSSVPRPRVGMIGALDEYKFDARLIRHCAERLPNFHFVLIGPMALKDKRGSLKEFGLEGIPNVHYLGPCPYEEKKYYYAGFDVDLIPYQLNDYTVGGCFPVKFHDSLAAGLPIVVTDLPAYAPFEDVCYISRTPDEFCRNIKRALDEDNTLRIKQRQQVAKENDWDNKVDKMLEHIEENDF